MNQTTSLPESLTWWDNAIQQLFPFGVPDRASWTSLNDIVAVLSHMASGRNANHTFYPTGGGNDLAGVKIYAGDPNCIELRLGGSTEPTSAIDIARPRLLEFEKIGANNEISYFRLEVAGLTSTGLDSSQGDRPREIVCEALSAPGDFLGGYLRLQEGLDRHGNELPADTRRVTRYYNGVFVTFAKGSIYNGSPHPLPDAYDARHNSMSRDDFRVHVRQMLPYHSRWADCPSSEAS